MSWTIEQLGKAKRRNRVVYFAYPTTLEGVTVKVEADNAYDVVLIANMIERAMERPGGGS